MAEPEGFEPSIRYNPYDDLANRCLQPLGHSSAARIRGLGLDLSAFADGATAPHKPMN